MQVEQEQYIQKVKEINNSKAKKYYILTMGCQLNENDSEKLAGMLSEMNYVETKINVRISISNYEKTRKSFC